MSRPKSDTPGPGRYAHLENILRLGRGQTRWPEGADRCPHCDGLAEFGMSTSPSTTGARFAWMQCGSCDGGWKADRHPGKPKKKNSDNRLKSKREARARAKAEAVA